MHDVSDLKVGDILRKDFKKWTRIGKDIFLTFDYALKDDCVLILHSILFLAYII